MLSKGVEYQFSAAASAYFSMSTLIKFIENVEGY